jgi:hypothetical protein
MLKTEFYPLLYKLHKEKRYLIWTSNTNVEDALYADNISQKIPSFSTLKQLRKYAKKKNIKVVKDKNLNLHHLDKVLKWMKNPKKKAMKCDDTLSTWNFFIDIANTFELDNDELQAYRSKAPKAYKIYSKVFFGNNLPSITKDNPPYHPKFRKKEIKLIKRVFSFGFETVDKYLILK